MRKAYHRRGRREQSSPFPSKNPFPFLFYKGSFSSPAPQAGHGEKEKVNPAKLESFSGTPGFEERRLAISLREFPRARDHQTFSGANARRLAMDRGPLLKPCFAPLSVPEGPRYQRDMLPRLQRFSSPLRWTVLLRYCPFEWVRIIGLGLPFP